MTHLTTCPDAETVAQRAAAHVVRELREAREARGIAHLALSGGTTPARTYELLAASPRELDDVEVWFADERCVPPQDAESNYRLAAEALLEPAGIPAERVHRMEGELGPDQGARRYALDLGGSDAVRSRRPRRDRPYSTWSCSASARTGMSPRCSRERRRWTPARMSCAWA